MLYRNLLESGSLHLRWAAHPTEFAWMKRNVAESPMACPCSVDWLKSFAHQSHLCIYLNMSSIRSFRWLSTLHVGDVPGSCTSCNFCDFWKLVSYGTQFCNSCFVTLEDLLWLAHHCIYNSTINTFVGELLNLSRKLIVKVQKEDWFCLAKLISKSPFEIKQSGETHRCLNSPR